MLYDDDTPEWAELKDEARRCWLLIGGMDFGDGPSATVYRGALVDWAAAQPHEEYGLLPRLWWDVEIYGFRSLPDEIGPRIMGSQRPYGGQWRIYGDPSGKHKLLLREAPWLLRSNRVCSWVFLTRPYSLIIRWLSVSRTLAQRVRYIQELLGHQSIRTTLIYLHVTKTGLDGIVSPLDQLPEPANLASR